VAKARINSKKGENQKRDFGFNRLVQYHFLFVFIGLSLFYHYIFFAKLYYNQFQTLFLLDRCFLYEFLRYPGGISEWVSLFTFQFLYYKWLGALILAACMVLIYIALYLICKKYVAVRAAVLWASLPVILLFGLQIQYNFPFYIVSKTLFLLALFMLFISIQRWIKTAAFLLTPVIYYILGGSFFILFVLLSFLHNLLLVRKSVKYIYIGLYVTTLLLLPYLAARYFFLITLNDAYFYMVPYYYYFDPISFESSPLFYIFNFTLFLVIAATYVYHRFWPGKIDRIIKPKSSFALHFLQIVMLCLVFLLFFVSYKWCFDTETRTKLKIEALADQNNWPEIFQEASNIREYDRLVNFTVNRAFYHTGCLLDRLFAFNQKLGVDGLFLSRFIASQIALSTSDLYFDLGHINAAQVFAYEALTKFPYHPRIYQRLVQTNIIQGNYAAAKKFITLLKESVIYRKWAQTYNAFIADTSLIAGNPMLQTKRSFTPDYDFFINAKYPRFDYRYLVQANSRNKMAVDYLFAFYLLEGNINRIHENLDILRAAGYRKLPLHIEEALLVYGMLNNVDLKAMIETYDINPDNVSRFFDFNKLLMQHRDDKEKARASVAQKYHTSYWYYLRFVNPKVTGFKLKSKAKDVDMYYFF
jgi:hypothetical protein